MTTYNKQTLKTFFEQGDVPSGTDYANLIDSQVNIVETSAQSMGGPLNTTELITSHISAGNANLTGGLTVAGITSASVLYADNVIASAATHNTLIATTFSGTVASLVTISANNGYITTFFQPVAIISAAGTAQATAPLASATICRLRGVTDGQATGIILASSKTGWEQVIHNETAVSANLYPTTGGSINGGSTNAPLALAGNTGYRVAHLTATTYSVK